MKPLTADVTHIGPAFLTFDVTQAAVRTSAEDAAINRAVNAKAAAVLQRQTADETVRLRKSNEEKLRAEAEMRAQATLKKMEDAQVSERAAENAFFASAQQSSEVFSPIAAAKMKLLGAEEKRVSVGSFYFPSLLCQVL